MRLFFAIWPDEHLRSALAKWRDGWTWPRDATPVANGKLHLTLHFLGEVAPERLPELEACAELSFTPFDLCIDQAVLWHHGIAVLEPRVIPASLLDLHAHLGSRLKAAGFALEERPYRPHVTLARRAVRARPPEPPPPPLDWRVDHFCLMQSKMGPNGQYEILQRWDARH
jgi:2'-5' RNA ligase